MMMHTQKKPDSHTTKWLEAERELAIKGVVVPATPRVIEPVAQEKLRRPRPDSVPLHT